MATPTTATTSVNAPPAEAPGLLTPDTVLICLTWLAFFALLFLLQKFAWKPILAGLQGREKYIRESLEGADRAKAELAQIEQTRVKILNEAKVQAAQIIDESRKTARDLAHDIEVKAKVNAQDIVQSASAQIEGERQRVRQALKKESVDVAISLAGKILKENTDTDKNRRLVDAEINQL